MINRHNQTDAEYIAQMKAAWGTQLDQYILTIRSIENKFERLCAQLDKLEEQQKAHDTLKSEHRRLLEDRQFWFEECDRIKAKQGELRARFDAEQSERMLFEQENAKHQQQRNALRVSLEEALKENARLKKAHDTLKSEHRRLLEDRQFWFGECGREIRHAPPRDGSLSIKEIIEGHAESIRKSVEGFPPWVQELKVKEQLGFFEPILEGPEDCPKTS